MVFILLRRNSFFFDFFVLKIRYDRHNNNNNETVLQYANERFILITIKVAVVVKAKFIVCDFS